MTAASNKLFTLFQNESGNSIEICNLKEGDETTISEQAQASVCKTHEAVLAFLHALSQSPNLKRIKFYHVNTKSDKHLKEKQARFDFAHLCNLQSQIDFVTLKISEAANKPKKYCYIRSKNMCFIL